MALEQLLAIEGHEIESDETLWRYCSVDRFEEITKNSRIYFASASQFLDRFEGAVAVQINSQAPDPRYAEMELVEQAFSELKRLTKISCWHRTDYESDAMWKLYAQQGKGIAICSTPARMQKAFTPFRLQPDYGIEEMWGSAIRYVDLTQIRMTTGELKRFYFKHRAFEWEKEFRLAISLRIAEEFGVQVPETGIEVSVDLNELVDHIIIGPEITPQERDRVASLVAGAGLNDRLRDSSLIGKPHYI
jgi:hypothetical protein